MRCYADKINKVLASPGEYASLCAWYCYVSNECSWIRCARVLRPWSIVTSIMNVLNWIRCSRVLRTWLIVTSTMYVLNWIRCALDTTRTRVMRVDDVCGYCSCLNGQCHWFVRWKCSDNIICTSFKALSDNNRMLCKAFMNRKLCILLIFDDEQHLW